jgi:hypothetical protein
MSTSHVIIAGGEPSQRFRRMLELKRAGDRALSVGPLHPTIGESPGAWLGGTALCPEDWLDAEPNAPDGSVLILVPESIAGLRTRLGSRVHQFEIVDAGAA